MIGKKAKTPSKTWRVWDLEFKWVQTSPNSSKLVQTGWSLIGQKLVNKGLKSAFDPSLFGFYYYYGYWVKRDHSKLTKGFVVPGQCIIKGFALFGPKLGSK